MHAHLVLAGLPGYEASPDRVPPLLREGVIEEYFLNAQQWHRIQKMLVNGIATLLILRTLYLLLLPAARRRHLLIMAERPVSVSMSWVCVISSGIMLQRTACACTAQV